MGPVSGGDNGVTKFDCHSPIVTGTPAAGQDDSSRVHSLIDINKDKNYVLSQFNGHPTSVPGAIQPATVLQQLSTAVLNPQLQSNIIAAVEND